jgi:hypothetical protein
MEMLNINENNENGYSNPEGSNRLCNRLGHIQYYANRPRRGRIFIDRIYRFDIYINETRQKI